MTRKRFAPAIVATCAALAASGFAAGPAQASGPLGIDIEDNPLAGCKIIRINAAVISLPIKVCL